MSHDLMCPTCGQTFDGRTCDDDYCPACGTRLVPAPPTDGPAGEAADTTAADPWPQDAAPADAATPSGPTETSEVPGPSTASAAPAEPAAAGQSPGDSRLADFMSRLGLRRAGGQTNGQPGGQSDPGADGPHAGPGPAAEASGPLPAAVLEQGWRISGPVQSIPGLVDRWPVARTGDDGAAVTGHFHRFRTGALTPDALYRRLEGGTTPHLAHLWAHGTLDLDGARADYELVSGPADGQALERWLADSTPTEQRAWHLLPRLVELVRQLGVVGVQPLVLEPFHLALTGAGALCLGTAAVLTERAAAPSYRPELERSPLLPPGWAAPELAQQNLASANAAVFSVGQVLAAALWGQPCSPADLQAGAVPFQAIADGRLARVLMGCLWPRPLERWTLDQLVEAAAADTAAAMPATPPWEALVPGAAATAFHFAGAAYWRLETLLEDAVAPGHWAEAMARLEALLDWAEGTAWVGQVARLRAALAQGRSPDWVLVALRHAVSPQAPLTWRGLDLTDAEAARSLAGLAQRALRQGEAEAATLRALFEGDLRGAWTP